MGVSPHKVIVIPAGHFPAKAESGNPESRRTLWHEEHPREGTHRQSSQ